MEYTVNNLSNRHDLKMHGNVFNAIIKKVESFDKTYRNLLKSDDDKKLTDFLINLNTRIAQWLKGILTEYINNKNSGKYFNTDTESNDPENYRETNNASMDISKLTEKITLDFFTNSINMSVCEMTAKMNDIPSYSLYDTINALKRNSDKRVRELIGLILSIFLVGEGNKPEAISSRRFVNSSLLIYNKSNTVDASVLRIKDILDEWLSEFNEKYNKTERAATKINFRKSLFLYFVFIIQYYYQHK
jgi:hypothetical protein